MLRIILIFLADPQEILTTPLFGALRLKISRARAKRL